jgi:hypothetical protein
MSELEELRCITNLSVRCLQANLILMHRLMSDSENQLVSTRALAPRLRDMGDILNTLLSCTGALA